MFGFLVLFSLWGCGSEVEVAPMETLSAAAAPLGFENARARATPPGAPNSAIFLEITNPGPGERAVVSARSEAAERVELHTHVSADGRMEMRQVERLVVPASGKLSLQPGGDHVMLIGLKTPLAEGGTVAFTLVLDDGTEAALTAPILAIEGMGGAHGAGLHDGAGPHGACAHGEGGAPCACGDKADKAEGAACACPKCAASGCDCAEGTCTCADCAQGACAKGAPEHAAH